MSSAKSPRRRAREFALQRTQVAMRKAVHRAEREACAVHDAGMVQLVREKVVVTADQRGDHAEVRLETRREDQRRLLVHEPGEALLQLLVQVQRAVQEAAARAPAAILVQRLLCRLQHPRVMRQPQVVVRADHDLALAMDDDFRVVRRLDRHKIRIIPGRLDLTGLREPVTFLEQTHSISSGHHAP